MTLPDLSRPQSHSRQAVFSGDGFAGTFFQDVRVSLRVLRKAPGFASVAILTLALAIGANAVVFGIANALIFRPLNVPQADSLYGVWRPGDNSAWQSYPDYLDLRDRNRGFEGLAAYGIAPAGLSTEGNPVRAWTEEVSGNYFDVLGIKPYLGRVFHASDEKGPNSAPYIVLAHSYWHTHFRDDRGVVGRTVLVNKHPFTIIGVASPDFRGTLIFFSPDFFVPMVNYQQVTGLDNLNSRNNRESVFMVLGHLKPGVTLPQATADLNSIGTYLENSYPKEDGKMKFTLARPGLYGDYVGGPLKAFLAGLMLLAGLILLAACANLGSLFSARASDRSVEIALRLALGSSRQRILRQLLTEAAILSLAGGVAGLMGSVVLLRALSAWRPFPQLPLHVPVTPDARVYAVALCMALLSGFLFGAVPTRQVLRTNPYQVVKSGPAGRMGRQFGARDVLVAIQIALCAVLVTSSMVAVRGLVRSLHSDFGFEPQDAMLAETDLSMAGVASDKIPAMQQRMLDTAREIPGVSSIALVDRPPLAGGGVHDTAVFGDKSTDLRPGHEVATAALYKISPEYFHTAQTTLLSGRVFTGHDDSRSPRVAVINREFGRKIFNSVQKALGSSFKLPDGTSISVVGVVEDGKYDSLTEDPRPAMFLPILQSPASETYMVLRSKRDPVEFAAAVKTVLSQLDPDLPLLVQPWTRELDTALFGPRMATISLGVLGVMAAILSITGIFGMAAYSVSKRVRELGVRVALGAQPNDVVRVALGRVFKLLAFGSVAGLILGVLAGPVLASIVGQATPQDPLVLGGVVIAMMLLGLAAAWVPARRALSVNPLILLREQ